MAERDETLPEPLGFVAWQEDAMSRTIYPSMAVLEAATKRWYPQPSKTERLYTEATLREAIKGARKKALSEAAIRAAIHSQYPVENDFDRGYGKSAKDAADRIRKLLEDEQ